MTRNKLAAFAFYALAAIATPALGQDAHGGHAGHGAAAAAPALPAVCEATGSPEANGEAAAMPGPAPRSEAHRALSEPMHALHRSMMEAMNAESIDVAFVCGMIPHHLGAIAMARAELAHGEDEWARTLAERIIASQEAEIAEMVEWLEAR